jgi:hypothetical protein
MIQLTKHNIIIALGSIIGVSFISIGVYYLIVQKQEKAPSLNDTMIADTIEEVPSELSGDALIDTTSGFELFPDDLSQDGISNEEKIALGLDPTEYDTDRDGLSDAIELQVGTDPLSPDTDADGLTDGQEVLIFDTNPLEPDTDGDGFVDGQEVEAGYSPLCVGNVLLFEPCIQN